MLSSVVKSGDDSDIDANYNSECLSVSCDEYTVKPRYMRRNGTWHFDSYIQGDSCNQIMLWVTYFHWLVKEFEPWKIIIAEYISCHIKFEYHAISGF